MDAKQIGEVIKEARKRKGKTQTALSAVIMPLDVLRYETGEIKHIPFEKRAKLSSVLNNEAVDELRENRLIKAVNAELEEWLCSGNVDYLYKAMAIIRAKIDNEE